MVIASNFTNPLKRTFENNLKFGISVNYLERVMIGRQNCYLYNNKFISCYLNDIKFIPIMCSHIHIQNLKVRSIEFVKRKSQRFFSNSKSQIILIYSSFLLYHLIYGKPSSYLPSGSVIVRKVPLMISKTTSTTYISVPFTPH